MPVRSLSLTAGAVVACAVATPLACAQSAAPVMRDIAMGLPDAPITIVEYASITCPACQHFQTDILPRLKARYILSGDAKFVLRDHPTPPAPVSFAGFALARCAGEDEFYGVIDDLFGRQTELLAAARSGVGARAIIVAIGAAHGLSEAAVAACIKDRTLQAFIQKQLDDAPDMTSTPAVFVNDKRVTGFTYEAIAQAVDEALEARRLAAATPAPDASLPAADPAAPPTTPASPAPPTPVN